MSHSHLQHNHEWKPILNIDKLVTFIPEKHREKYTDASSNTVTVLNLLDHGYAKLLSKGRISFPVVVRARYVSAEAEKKITDAGGVVQLVA